LKFKNILSNGVIMDVDEENLEPIIEKLRNKQDWLHNLEIGDILDFIDKVGEFWKEEFGKNNDFNSNIEYVCNFLKKENLSRDLTISLRGNYKILDEFVSMIGDKKFVYHAQPRGLAVHWIAGNVDILGIFSIVQSLITKNVCLVKVPHNYDTLKKLIHSMCKVSTEKISGNEFIKCISLVYIERNDMKNQQTLSDSADIRIAWGGKEAIDTIVGLKKKFHTEDIIYGPKYSYAIIDEDSINDTSKRIPEKLALDISTFDQYACNSPHTIFVQSKNKEIVKQFAEDLASSMDITNRVLLPKQPVSEKKAMEILTLRTEYEMKGDVYASKNTDWTVLYSEEENFAEPCFSRVVFVRPITDIKKISAKHNKKIQTIGLAIDDFELRKKIADQISIKGGDRCPTIGNMSHFNPVWDGMFGMDRMVRWVTTYSDET
jgi:hypothetical protein